MTLHLCNPIGLCEGGLPGQQCRKGHTGEKCRLCKKHHFLTRRGVCKPCKDPSLFSIFVLLGITLFGFVLVVSAAATFSAWLWTPALFPHEADCMIPVFMECVLAMVKTYQLYAIIGHSSSQSSVVQGMSTFDALFFDIRLLTHVLRPDCLFGFQLSQRCKLIVNGLSPLIFGLIAFGVAIAFARGVKDKAVRWSSKSTAVIVRVTFIGSMVDIFKLFHCDADFDDGESRLFALSSIHCSSSEYVGFATFGICMLGAYAAALVVLSLFPSGRFSARTLALRTAKAEVLCTKQDRQTVYTVEALCSRGVVEPSLMESSSVAAQAALICYAGHLKARLGKHCVMDPGAYVNRVIDAHGGPGSVVMEAPPGYDTDEGVLPMGEWMAGEENGVRMNLWLGLKRLQGQSDWVSSLDSVRKYTAAWSHFDLFVKMHAALFAFIPSVPDSMSQMIIGLGLSLVMVLTLISRPFFASHLNRTELVIHGSLAATCALGAFVEARGEGRASTLALLASAIIPSICIMYTLVKAAVPSLRRRSAALQIRHELALALYRATPIEDRAKFETSVPVHLVRGSRGLPDEWAPSAHSWCRRALDWSHACGEELLPVGTCVEIIQRCGGLAEVLLTNGQRGWLPYRAVRVRAVRPEHGPPGSTELAQLNPGRVARECRMTQLG